MSWPQDFATSRGVLHLPAVGRYVVMPAVSEDVIDELLTDARRVLGDVGVGWLPEGGGLLSNLPAWENILLSTQWHAPASLPALEARVRAWLERLGYDNAGAALLLSLSPSRLDADERSLIGWLRLLLARPKLILLAGQALPEGALGQRILALVDEELAACALVVVDDEAPAWFIPLSLRHVEASSP